MSSFLPVLCTQVLTACWNKGVYSKTHRCQNCSAHSCKERNKERLSSHEHSYCRAGSPRFDASRHLGRRMALMWL